MNQQLFINGFATVLAATLSATATQMTLAAGQGQILRNAGVGGEGDFFRVELTQAGTETSNERVYITSVSGDVANILRNRDNSKAAAWTVGDKVRSHNRISQRPPIMAAAKAPNTFTLDEGQSVTITGNGSAAASVTVSTQNGVTVDMTVNITANSSKVIGPVQYSRQIVMTPTAGSIDATVGDAVLSVKQDVCNLRMGQSTDHGSVYPQLGYTTSAPLGTGTLVTISTTVANNLPVGDVVLGRVSGVTPAGYNTGINVAMTVGGTWPNCTLTYASTGTGAQTVAGTLIIDQEAMAPELFASQRYPAQRSPYAPALTYDGGFISGLYDKMFDAGYNAHILNACLGSISLVQDVIGQLSAYNVTGNLTTDTSVANQHFRVRRAPAGNGDLGCVGALILGPLTNSLFECTGGGDEAYVYYNDAKPVKIAASISAFTIDYRQNVVKGTGSGSTLNSAWAGKTAGQTVTDGDLTWTCISPNTVADTDVSIKGTINFTPFAEGKYGFDPFGIMKRSFAEGDRAARGKAQKVCTWSNAQSDVSSTQAWYQAAITSFGNYSARRGWKTVFELSIFNPNTTGANYDKLWAGIEAAIPPLQTSWPGLIFKGVNLSTDPAIGRVHGQGNLFLESDNGHVGENVHPQARTSRACIAPVAASLLAVLNA